MTFHEVTRMMLNSMDFFELRRTAGRYAVPFQGVRRQKLIRDLERAIVAKKMAQLESKSATSSEKSIAERSPEGAVSAKPNLNDLPKVERPMSGLRINTFSTRSALPRPRA